MFGLLKTKKRKKDLCSIFSTLLALGLIMAPTAASADVSVAINYQGRLRGSNGELVNGTKDITFNVREGNADCTIVGAAKDTYTQTNVSVNNGVFFVSVPINNFDAADFRFQSSPYCLEVIVDGESLGSEPLTAVPMAINSHMVDGHHWSEIPGLADYIENKGADLGGASAVVQGDSGFWIDGMGRFGSGTYVTIYQNTIETDAATTPLRLQHAGGDISVGAGSGTYTNNMELYGTLEIVTAADDGVDIGVLDGHTISSRGGNLTLKATGAGGFWFGNEANLAFLDSDGHMTVVGDVVAGGQLAMRGNYLDDGSGGIGFAGNAIVDLSDFSANSDLLDSLNYTDFVWNAETQGAQSNSSFNVSDDSRVGGNLIVIGNISAANFPQGWDDTLLKDPVAARNADLGRNSLLNAAWVGDDDASVTMKLWGSTIQDTGAGLDLSSGNNWIDLLDYVYVQDTLQVNNIDASSNAGYGDIDLLMNEPNDRGNLRLGGEGENKYMYVYYNGTWGEVYHTENFPWGNWVLNQNTAAQNPGTFWIAGSGRLDGNLNIGGIIYDPDDGDVNIGEHLSVAGNVNVRDMIYDSDDTDVNIGEHLSVAGNVNVRDMIYDSDDTDVNIGENLYVAGNTTSSIYYDRENLTFYANPAEDSRLYRVDANIIDFSRSVASLVTEDGILYRFGGDAELGVDDRFNFRDDDGTIRLQANTDTGSFFVYDLLDMNNNAYYWDGDDAAISMTVAGNVGIGTTAPAAKLAVEGGAHIGGITDPGVDNLMVDGRIYLSDAAGIMDTYLYRDSANRIATPDSFYVQNTSAVTYLYSANTYLGQSGDFIHLRNNQLDWDTGILTTTGNMGIGTTSPTYRLHVEGTGYFADDLTIGNSQELCLTGDPTTPCRNTWPTGYWDRYTDTAVPHLGNLGLNYARLDNVRVFEDGGVAVGGNLGVAGVIHDDYGDDIVAVGDPVNMQGNDIDNIGTASFVNNDASIRDNADGLVFDGGDANPDFLVYDDMIYSDRLRLGYSGAALVDTNDVDEDLTIDPNGSGDIILQGNVGIGVAAPSYNLDVVTSGRIPYLYDTAAVPTSGVTGQVLTRGASGVLWRDTVLGAESGLYFNTTTRNARLGTNPLLENTTITQSGAFGFTIANAGTANTVINLSSTGDFVVQDAGASVLFVQDTGNVGIGTNVPLAAAKLDINGQIRIQGGTPALGQVLTTDATGLATWEPVAETDPQVGVVTAGRVCYGITGNIVECNDAFYVNTVNDRLGIGVAAPSYNLDVVTTGRIPYLYDTAAVPTSGVTGQVLTRGASGVLWRDTVLGAESGLYFNTTTRNARLGTNPLLENTTITQGTFEFNIANTGAANTTINLSSTGDFNIQDNGVSALFVRDDGNVGIGTTAPQSDLEVIGKITIGTVGASNIYTNSLSAKRVDNFLVPLITYDTSDNMYVGNEGGNYMGKLYLRGGGGDVSISPNGAYDALIVKAASGRVGIGTTAPAYMLQVQGTGYFYNDLTLANTNGVDWIGGDNFDLGGGTDNIFFFHLPDTSGKVSFAYGGLAQVTADSLGSIGLNGGLSTIAENNPTILDDTIETSRLCLGDAVTGAEAFCRTTWPIVQAENGLYVSSERVRMGGSLIENTTITQGGFGFNIANNGTANTTINLSSTGDLDVQDNGVSALYVRDDGNIGIGTTAPIYKLHVLGDIYANGGWLRSSGIAGWYSESYGGGWHMSDTFWIRTYNSKSVWTNTGLLGSDGGLTVGYGGAAPSSGGAIIANNVGIGTAAPAQRLTVAAGNILLDNGYGLKIRDTDTNAYTRLLTSTGNVTWLDSFYGGSQGELRLSTDSTDGYITLGTVTGNIAGYSEKMRMTKDGYVGIGTTAPYNKLEVVGVSGGTGFSGSDGTGGVRVDWTSGYGIALDAWDPGSPRWGITKYSVDTPTVVMEGRYNSTNVLFNAGNVGIGTTAPLERLHVYNGAIGSSYTGGRALIGTGTQGSLDFLGIGANTGTAGFNDISSNAWFDGSNWQRRSTAHEAWLISQGVNNTNTGKWQILHGTSGANPLAWSSAYLTVDAVGNVGLKDTDPLQPLVVAGPGDTVQTKEGNNELSYAGQIAIRGTSGWSALDFIDPDGLDYKIHVNGGSMYFISAPWNFGSVANAGGARLDSTGSFHIAGSYYCNAADIAEITPAEEELAAGEVVALSSDNEGKLRRSRYPYEQAVAGVVSTSPGIVLGSNLDILPAPESLDTSRDQNIIDIDGVQLALAGRVPVRVTTENGPIRVGDLLVSSSLPGYAMKGDIEKIKEIPGVVLGKAMGSLEQGEGEIMVLISLQ